MGNILVACEFSGTVRNEFAKLGHYALSCDLLDTESDFVNANCAHYTGDIKDILDDKNVIWDLMIAHPPCTFLTNAGVRHLHEDVTSKNGVRAKIHGKARWNEMLKACEFFNLLQKCNIPRICIENPIPHGYARERIGKYTQIIQPWMFGHPETKATCLWLKNLPRLMPTNNVKAHMLTLPKNEQHKIHHMAPSKDRWKKRSLTYPGVAQAFASHWGFLF